MFVFVCLDRIYLIDAEEFVVVEDHPVVSVVIAREQLRQDRLILGLVCVLKHLVGDKRLVRVQLLVDGLVLQIQLPENLSISRYHVRSLIARRFLVRRARRRARVGDVRVFLASALISKVILLCQVVGHQSLVHILEA